MSEIIEGRNRKTFKQKIGPVEYTVVAKEKLLDEQSSDQLKFTGGSNFLTEGSRRIEERARESQSKQNTLFSNYSTPVKTQGEKIEDLIKENISFKKRISDLESEKRE